MLPSRWTAATPARRGNKALSRPLTQCPPSPVQRFILQSDHLQADEKSILDAVYHWGTVNSVVSGKTLAKQVEKVMHHVRFPLLDSDTLQAIEEDNSSHPKRQGTVPVSERSARNCSAALSSTARDTLLPSFSRILISSARVAVVDLAHRQSLEIPGNEEIRPQGPSVQGSCRQPLVVPDFKREASTTIVGYPSPCGAVALLEGGAIYSMSAALRL